MNAIVAKHEAQDTKLFSAVWMNEKGRELQNILFSLESCGCVCGVAAPQCLHMDFFLHPLTCLELQAVHCVACWPGHTVLPGVDRCPGCSGEGESSGDSGGDGSGDCKDPCCCYPPTSLMIRCRRRCAPHPSWRCGRRCLGSQRIPSPLPAFSETPASWPVFCDKQIISDVKCKVTQKNHIFESGLYSIFKDFI